MKTKQFEVAVGYYDGDCRMWDTVYVDLPEETEPTEQNLLAALPGSGYAIDAPIAFIHVVGENEAR